MCSWQWQLTMMIMIDNNEFMMMNIWHFTLHRSIKSMSKTRHRMSLRCFASYNFEAMPRKAKPQRVQIAMLCFLSQSSIQFRPLTSCEVQHRIHQGGLFGIWIAHLTRRICIFTINSRIEALFLFFQRVASLWCASIRPCASIRKLTVTCATKA